jgi:hypothetical protein
MIVLLHIFKFYDIMKKIFFTAVAVVFLYANSFACEICGCGVGSYYIGILPQFKHHFVGIRYHVSSFNTRLNDDPTQFSKDLYQSTELWAGWNVSRRFQVLTMVPYNFNHQNSDEGTSNQKGISDVLLIGNYKLWDHSTTNHAGNAVQQQLWIGGGIKIPTGKFEIEKNDPDLASMANMQIGSGSTDFLANVMYNVRVGQWGLNTSASYKLNTANKDDFKFGNKFSANSFLFYTVQANNVTLNPNIGLLFENSAASTIDNATIGLTGGNLLLASAGLELGFKKIAVGFNTQLPAAQNFAEGQTKTKVQGMAHITFAF